MTPEFLLTSFIHMFIGHLHQYKEVTMASQHNLSGSLNFICILQLISFPHRPTYSHWVNHIYFIPEWGIGMAHIANPNTPEWN